MNKILLYTSLAAIITATAFAPQSHNDSGSQASLLPETERTNPDSLIKVAGLKSGADFTIPSFTRLRMAVVAVENDSSRAGELAYALNNLVPAGMPYSITVNINGNPTGSMAFNWLTDSGHMAGQVRIVKGIAKNDKKFRRAYRAAAAVSVPVDTLPYSVPGNKLDELAKIPAGTKKSYSSHKAEISGLKPGTVYSYRVGNDNYWSATGTFRTASKNPEEVNFIYTTDSQATTMADFNVSQTTTHTAFKTYPDVEIGRAHV